MAEAYLLAAGNRTLLARNFRCKAGEIDLVFEERGVELVFVEVRCRLKGGWVDGVSSVTFGKQRRLKRAIAQFLARYRGQARSARVDLLAWDGKAWEHLRDLRL
ncbi:MAG: YraN family protein [Oligoflexia bacterium]|nr:YraN family protein [Oligoflexia bacterium]